MIDQFFAFARQRHLIYLLRQGGMPRPWTDDLVLQTGRFTNVYRELDRTTAWFRKHVRAPMRDSPEVLLATVVFRWFNRTTTGEAIFLQKTLDGSTAWQNFARTQDTDHLGRAIRAYCGKGPYITGAYTINTRSAGIGLTKLDGVLVLIEMWLGTHQLWRAEAEWMLKNQMSLEAFCRWCRSPCLAEFMTYEVACDLRYTELLCRAPDTMTWANPGPGAVRGLNRIFGREVKKSLPRQEAITEIQGLLTASRSFWPGDWPAWEMREVEHTLCEFDKYQRVTAGEGRTRGAFRGR